jgi:hypothetical protein
MLDILAKHGLKYEDLNAAERDTLDNWMKSIAQKILTVGMVRDYVVQMKESVEADIAGYDQPKSLWDFLFRERNDIYRRARLRNYLLLIAFLEAPQKAQKALENSLQGVKPTR